jgi:hypothetical protein
VTYARRSCATHPRELRPHAARDEHLLALLRALINRTDPVPEHVTAAAQSAFSAHRSNGEATAAPDGGASDV